MEELRMSPTLLPQCVLLLCAMMTGYGQADPLHSPHRTDPATGVPAGRARSEPLDGAAQPEGKSHGGPVILQSFPEDPRLFTIDLRDHVTEILRRHGHGEWRATVLTNEIHQHLGIYSILGAKMGLRARELLQAGMDDIRVVSRAGSQPPLSCLNDGLQISTGATLGQGTISLSPDSGKRAEAEFSAGGRTVGLRLKGHVRKQIDSDIAEGIRRHGNLTPAYFDYVRHLAIRYWLEMDRREVFEAVP